MAVLPAAWQQICGMLCAVVATAKGRNALGWLVLGLLTGVFGLIAVAGMPPLDPSAPRTPHGPQASDIGGLAVALGCVLIALLALAALAAALDFFALPYPEAALDVFRNAR
jgi:hypothetical protein